MMFFVRRDAALPLLLVTLRGFWTVETVDEYAATLSMEIGTALSQGDAIGLLIDCSDYPVQSAEVTQRFTDVQATWPLPSPDGIFGVAIIAGSALNKIQVQRTFGSAITAFFDRHAALTWLVAQSKP